SSIVTQEGHCRSVVGKIAPHLWHRCVEMLMASGPLPTESFLPYMSSMLSRSGFAMSLFRNPPETHGLVQTFGRSPLPLCQRAKEIMREWTDIGACLS